MPVHRQPRPYSRSRSLTKALFLVTSRYAIFLDVSNHMVKLLVKNGHIVNILSWNELTRSILMENYWILLCRLTVRQTLRNCLSCHRLLQEVLAPLMAGLPKDRLPTASHYPFHTTGLDFIGFSRFTITTIDIWDTFFSSPAWFYARITQKYLLIFLLTAQLLHQKFFCRQGEPTNFISNNGSSFASANKVLKSSVSNSAQSSDFKDKLSLVDINIEWVFNPPGAPHFGGSWERLSKLFKLSLISLSVCKHGMITPSFAKSNNLVCKIKFSMSLRPLSNVPADITDPFLLSRNHFFLGRPSNNVPPLQFSEQVCHSFQIVEKCAASCSTVLELFRPWAPSRRASSD